MLRMLVLFICFAGVFTRGVGAEQHRVQFDNRCGYGTPRLLRDGKILSQGGDFVSDGPFTSGIAYLQTGNCNLNGEGCTLVEMTLVNPGCPGCGSSVDISLIPPLAFSVPTSFSYFNGCDGQGAVCGSANCGSAFYVPSDNHVQVQCEEYNVDLLISFCGGGSVGENTVEYSVSSSPPPVATTSVTPKHLTEQSIKPQPQPTPALPQSSHPIAHSPRKRCSENRHLGQRVLNGPIASNLYRRHAKSRYAF